MADEETTDTTATTDSVSETQLDNIEKQYAEGASGDDDTEGASGVEDSGEKGGGAPAGLSRETRLLAVAAGHDPELFASMPDADAAKLIAALGEKRKAAEAAKPAPATTAPAPARREVEPYTLPLTDKERDKFDGDFPAALEKCVGEVHREMSEKVAELESTLAEVRAGGSQLAEQTWFDAQIKNLDAPDVFADGKNLESVTAAFQRLRESGLERGEAFALAAKAVLYDSVGADGRRQERAKRRESQQITRPATRAKGPSLEDRAKDALLAVEKKYGL